MLMKKFLLSLAVMALGATAVNAETVVLNVNNATDIAGTLVEEELKEDNTVKAAKHYQPLNSLKISDWSFSFAKGSGTTEPAYYYPTSTSTSTKNSVRIYNGNSATITAPAGVLFTKITAVADNNTNEIEIYSGVATDTYTINASGTVRIHELTVTTGESGEVAPVSPTVYENTFSSSIADWTVENKIDNDYKGWKINNSPKCAIANSYVNSVNLEADSWLISPELDLTDRTDCQMSVAQGFGFYFPTEQGTEYTVNIKEIGTTDWTVLPLTVFPPKKSSGNWSDFADNVFDLSAYNGKKVQIAFRYLTDGSGSKAWELQNFIVTGTPQAGSAVDELEADENAEAVYYNLQGVKVAEPETGLYIKVQGKKATKVFVRK